VLPLERDRLHVHIMWEVLRWSASAASYKLTSLLALTVRSASAAGPRRGMTVSMGRVAGLKVIFVTPSEVATGEAITALDFSRRLCAAGAEVMCLASASTERLLRGHFPGTVISFTGQREANQLLWRRSVQDARPDAIVFADYPLLFLSSGVVPLVDDEWVASLVDMQEAGTVVFTFDHVGYAQRPRTVFFGPAHLTIHAETIPALPAGMEILLPCPSNHPGEVTGRKGTPFRLWDVPLGLARCERRSTREPFVAEHGMLVLHSTPIWARKAADTFGLPFYELLLRMLQSWLAGAGQPVTIVSVNGGRSRPTPVDPDVTIVNLTGLAPRDYQRLLLGADLFVTENGVSAGLGRAICGLVPCGMLCNAFTLSELLSRAEPNVRALLSTMEAERLGSVFPFEVFPIWDATDVQQLGLFRENNFVEAVARIEVFGGEDTRLQLQGLLGNGEGRAVLLERQRAYVNRISSLPGPESTLAMFMGPGHARGRM
jgi:Family of unknown function (DUF6365)